MQFRRVCRFIVLYIAETDAKGSPGKMLTMPMTAFRERDMSEQGKSTEADTDEAPAGDSKRCGRRCRNGGCHRRCGPRWAKLLVVVAIVGAAFAWHHHSHGGQWCAAERHMSLEDSNP